MASDVLLVRILGPLEVSRGAAAIPLPRGGQRALLTYLLLHSDQSVSRHELRQALWADPPKSADKIIQIYVSRLRRALGSGVFAEGSVAYRIRRDSIELDLHDFDALVADASQTREQGDLELAAAKLGEALRLWHGPALADFEVEPFVRIERMRLEERRMAALEDRVELDLELDRHAAVVSELEVLVEQYPLRERLRGLLMVALYRSGRQADALEVYRKGRKDFIEELGIEPAPELRRLEHAVLTHDPSLDRPATPTQDPSARRRAVRVRRVGQDTRLIGRERELAQVCALLRREEVRLVTLTGRAGAGKTRVALETAAELVDEFRHGAAFVSLTAITDPMLVASAIAEAIGVRASGRRSLLSELTGALRQRELLLVLDNFEHVLAAGPLVADLVGGASGLTVLIASKTPLGHPLEYVYPIPSLSSPESGDGQDLASLGQYEAVNLFVSRSESLALTTENAAAVAEICAFLDGLPLAIELVAARTRNLSPVGILKELETVGPGLRAGDGAPRRDTLRTTIEWAHAHLNPHEQELFRRLAVFRGGCTLEAARTVSEGTPATLGLLVETRLVRQHGAHGDVRLSMHEAVREAAFERLVASGEAPLLQRGHAEYFLNLAEASRDELFGARQAKWLGLLEGEHANFRAALEWSREPGGAEFQLRLAAALARFWKVRGHFREGRRWLGEAITRSPDRPVRARAEALAWASVLALHQGAVVDAKRFSSEQLALCRELDHSNGIAHSLLTLGNVAVAEGDNDSAKALYRESRRISVSGGNANNIAASTMNLGYLALSERRFERARLLCEEALVLFRRLEDIEGVALGLHNLGSLALFEEDHRRAVELLKESLRLSQDLSHAELVVWCLEALAALLTAQDEPERATRLMGSAEALRESSGAALHAAERDLHKRTVLTLRSQLDEQTFAAHWFAGRALPPEEALPYAVETAAKSWAA